MRRRSLLLSCVMLFPVGLWAQTTPDVDQILNRYIAAVGGKEALAKATSRLIKETQIQPNGDIVPIDVYTKAPNKRLQTALQTDGGAFESGFDGSVAWMRMPNAAATRITDPAQFARFRREADFYRPVKLKEQYRQLEMAGKEHVGNREAWVIRATPVEGPAEKLYFDVKTGLLVRMESNRMMLDNSGDQPEQRVVPTVIDYDDYREVEGVKLPFTTRMNLGEGLTVKIQIDEVRNNVTIDDARFQMPS